MSLTQTEIDQLVSDADEIKIELAQLVEFCEALQTKIIDKGINSDTIDLLVRNLKEDQVLVDDLIFELKALKPPPPPSTGDWPHDPNAYIVSSDETINSPFSFTTIVVKEGAILTLKPGAVLTKIAGSPDLTIDPAQLSHGIIVEGRLEVHGTIKTSVTRATHALIAGETTVNIGVVPPDWKVGDRIVIAGSLQRRTTKTTTHREFTPVTDYSTIVGMSHNSIVLEDPLVYDHPLTQFGKGCHVINMSRDITIQSEDPSQPGHLMMHMNGSCNLTGIEFIDFGRTRAEQILDSECDGTPGTNQIARYAIHWHLVGDNGINSKLSNVSITRPQKWGVTIHGTNYVEVIDTHIYGSTGAAFVFEDGSEHSNKITACGAIQCGSPSLIRKDTHGGVIKLPEPTCSGKEEFDLAFRGSGFWSRGIANDIVDCYIADCFEAAINDNGYYQKPEQQATYVDGLNKPVGKRENIEAYAVGEIIWNTWPQGVFSGGDLDMLMREPMDGGKHKRQIYTNIEGSHVFRFGIAAYHTANITFDFDIRCDARITELVKGDNGGYPNVRTLIGLDVNDTYQMGGFKFVNCRLSGFTIGLWLPMVCAGSHWFEWKNGILDNYVNILHSVAKFIDRQPCVVTNTVLAHTLENTPKIPEAWIGNTNMPQEPVDIMSSEAFLNFSETQSRRSDFNLDSIQLWHATDPNVPSNAIDYPGGWHTKYVPVS